jgi:hypothetical protein
MSHVNFTGLGSVWPDNIMKVNKSFAILDDPSLNMWFSSWTCTFKIHPVTFLKCNIHHSFMTSKYAVRNFEPLSASGSFEDIPSELNEL